MDGDTQFALVNATISFESMLSSYPGPVELVTIQYPDPHFKKRHRKRHLVQAPLCLEIAAKLEPGGVLSPLCPLPHYDQTLAT